jgi:large subunit ribosomal protein L6
MSRKGKMPIQLPKGVEVKVANNTVTVKGSKGTLTQELVPGVLITVEPEHVLVAVANETRELGRMHGLYRALIQNMIVGVTAGFKKRLEMVGVGYRAAVQGTMLDLQIGTSHPTQLLIPQGIKVAVDKNTVIDMESIDKQKVGQFAAEVRAMKPPEPYQGKGIRYEGEYVRKKAGKAAKTAAK